MSSASDDFAHLPISSPVLQNGHNLPRCALCGEPFEPDNEDEIILVIHPMLLETSKKSGRVRLVDYEFNVQRNGLDGLGKFYWHYECAVEQLLDPSVIGHFYD